MKCYHSTTFSFQTIILLFSDDFLMYPLMECIWWQIEYSQNGKCVNEEKVGKVA